MKGNNTLRLNADTIREAVQMWVDAQFTEKVVVRSVKQADKAAYGDGGTFEVEVSSVDPTVG